MNIKAIIFDWGRTLFDPETKRNFLIQRKFYCIVKKRVIRFCVASLVRNETTIEEEKSNIIFR